ncbi:uncharacterized protein LOC133918576 [Phragmites australis]|uniref:uncharacterized protein LOC133918576 n=1 Tax=Phragmites australis TaxID=29695 RepID=UPI002D7652A7|nr:uncharacterized protein LOC133918576 [Phragmites australis]
MGDAGEEPLREVPDEIADEILLRLPSRSALARAAAACGDFRTLVSSPRFLRRHRALHPDKGALLGVFTFSLRPNGVGGGAAFHPAEPPHPAAAAARAVARAADFSFGFLPAGAGAEAPEWMVRDYRDGRFLLDRASAGTGSILFTELAVCDPLSRRYVLLPPIPDDLAAAVVNPLTVFYGRRRCEPFLTPAEAGEVEAEPSFTVIWTARCPRKVVAFAFSSRDGQWCALPSPDCFVWRRNRSPFSCPIHAVWNRRHYAHGRFYWVDCLTNRWLVLDTRAMELTVAEIPSPAGYWEEHVAVVEAPDGKVGVFAHDFYHGDGKAKLCYYTIEHDGEGGDAPRWQLEKTVPLPWPADYGRPFCVRDTANGCLVLEVSEDMPAFMASHRTRDVELFKIDVKCFQLERICQVQCAAGAAGERCLPYFGFPPLLSLPTV